MTAAFAERFESDQLWRKFATLMDRRGRSDVPFPWFDGSNVWVVDRVLILRFSVFAKPEPAGLLMPWRGKLWTTPDGERIEWEPPFRVCGLISPEPCRKPLSVVPVAEPLKEQEFEPLRVLNVSFSRRYLWIVQQLPELTIEVRRGAMQLQFEYGRGVLMGMERL